MITITELEFKYPTGKFSLSLNTLKLEKAGKTAVIGPSGTGKTTLLNLVAGIMTPNRGMIDIDGIDVCKLNDRDQLIR